MNFNSLVDNEYSVHRDELGHRDIVEMYVHMESLLQSRGTLAVEVMTVIGDVAYTTWDVGLGDGGVEYRKGAEGWLVGCIRVALVLPP